ncbi:MAG: mechanosensitive ion channel family protein [Xanthomonadales bacterium]|jgi:MscS family membrane protein|nr:mechanosensitive ion channel family protein [Xanthomonadales bacterium]
MEWLSGFAETLSVTLGLRSWVIAVFTIVLVAMLIDFVQRRMMKRLADVVSKSENLWDDAIFDAAVRPVTMLVWLIGITLAIQVIPIRQEGSLLQPDLIAKIREIGILYAITWMLYAFVRNIESSIVENARREQREVDQTTVAALGRVVRITIVVTASLVALDTLGFNVAGLMAAGGIGGLAIGLAAKDLIANFFGGVTVFIDRPFGIGDWILLKEKGIEGVVENIGWRQTTIRKFDKRPVYVPNAVFTTASVENPSRMTHRRINETIGLRYRDLDQIKVITDEVREMLLEHPEIDGDQTLMVHLNAFGESSVDFFIYCMTHTVNWQKFHEIKQDVLLKISEIVNRHDAAIAFPTRTLDLESVSNFSRPESTREQK